MPTTELEAAPVGAAGSHTSGHRSRDYLAQADKIYDSLAASAVASAVATTTTAAAATAAAASATTTPIAPFAPEALTDEGAAPSASRSPAASAAPAAAPAASAGRPAEPLSVCIRHHVRWECVDEYHDWLELMVKAMQGFDGFLSLRRLPTDPADDDDDDDATVQACLFRFASLPTLHAWLYSAERGRMLAQLAPLLHSPSLVVAARDRRLPDAFTDVLASHGKGAPLRPPPKWKVVLLILPALFSVVWPCSLKLPAVYDACGITSPVARAPLGSFVTVFLNTYFSLPLVTRLCGHWLHRPRPAHTDAQPWRSLDQGFRTQRSRLAMAILYFAPLTVAWVLRETR